MRLRAAEHNRICTLVKKGLEAMLHKSLANMFYNLRIKIFI